MKTKWIIIIIILIAIAFYFYNRTKPCKEAYNKCLEYITYDPERKAYRWKFEFVDEWYQTKDEAMEACINKQSEIFCH